METYIEIIDGKEYSFPKVLYKYRTWDTQYHKDILFNNTIYFASPALFEDIKDCNVPERFPDGKSLRAYFTRYIRQNHPGLNWAKRERLLSHYTSQSPLVHKNLLKGMIEDFKELFEKRFGVLSLTPYCNENRMWEKYGDSHRGVCFGFDTKKLFQVAGGGSEVIYVNELPVIDFLNDENIIKIHKQCYYKEREWDFEKEYRLQKMWDHEASDAERNITMVPNTIVEIILGRDISTDAANEIKKYVSNNNLEIRISKESEN